MKRRVRATAAFLVVSAGLAACGRSASAPGAEASPAPPATSTPSPSASTQPAATTTPADPLPATPVDPALLVALLPDLFGWTRSQPRGEQLSAGVFMSKADAEYSRGESAMKLEIIDSAQHRLLMAPLSIMLMPKYSEKTADGFKQFARVGKHPGFESWQDELKEGDATVVVANRFIVNVRGLNVANLDPVRSLVRAINLDRLATLK